MPTSQKHCRALELDKVLQMLAEFAVCADTKQKAISTQPAADFYDARHDLALTAAAHTLSTRYGTPGIAALSPCAQLVARAKAGAALSPRELLELAAHLRCARNLIQWRKEVPPDTPDSALLDLFARLGENRALEEEIADCIFSEDEISDRASPALYDIRRGIRTAQQRARETLEKITRSSAYEKFLQEQIVTLRNGRFVVPVKVEYRGEIKGLVHDTSSSGATLFVEPMAVVEQNNKIRELESAQQHEIHRILLELSGQAGNCADLLLDNYDSIIQLDLCFAKSRLADQMFASVPTLVESGETNLKKARHPLIPAQQVVAVDLMLGGEFDTLIITGPNTGGKTVALKTLGLLALMAQCGLMLPCAEQSTICFFDQVLADIGDEQSIEQSLSTFSGHMSNIVTILAQANERSLVLLDELGAGTDPTEGAALAVAIIDRLREQGAKISATTHYTEMKIYALHTPGVQNASCEFDVATLRPTYRLLIGTPGRSNAFAIGERLGLPPYVIEAARLQISGESARFEDVVERLEANRQELEAEKEQTILELRSAQAEREQAQKLREQLEHNRQLEMKKAREQARSLVEQVKFQSEKLLAELDELKKQQKEKNFAQEVSGAKSHLRAQLRDLEDTANPITPPDNSNYRLPRKLRRGDRVLLTELGSEGTVLTLPDPNGNLQVQAGILKTRVHQSSLRLVQDPPAAPAQKGTVNARGVLGRTKDEVRTELDLRGMDAQEALMELERYIDQALLSNVKTIHIIHGKGTGALRTAVQNRLRRHKSVARYRLGVYGEGESGVTVAELK